jgi:hypothetical protein
LLRVQIIEKLESVRVTRQGIPIEVAMTQNFHHLGVLRSIAWGIGQPDPGAAAARLCLKASGVVAMPASAL